MVVVIAKDAEEPDASVCVIIPRRIDDGFRGGWQWDELSVCESRIAGLGLVTRESEWLDWSSPGCVCVPILGRETELGSAAELDVFARVLTGTFIEVRTDSRTPTAASRESLSARRSNGLNSRVCSSTLQRSHLHHPARSGSQTASTSSSSRKMSLLPNGGVQSRASRCCRSCFRMSRAAISRTRLSTFSRRLL